MQIVDAIRNGLPARGGGGRDHEVVDLYPRRRLRRAPGAARVLERADQLLLLGVHRNRRLLLPLRASHAPGDVPKLRVPIDMLAALTSLGVALQAVAQSVQQLGDHRVADAVAQTVERHRQRPCALARPPQRRVGIAGGGRLNQRIQIAQQRRVEIDRALAAAARPSRPAARERLVRRQFTQTALDGRCRDTRGSGDQRRAAITDRLGPVFGQLALVREDEVDLLDVLGTELVLVLALGVFAVGVDEEHLAAQRVRFVLVHHQDAGRDAGAVKEAGRQADDRLDHIVVDEDFPDQLFLATAEKHAVGHDRCHVAVGLQARQHVLDEHQVGLLAGFGAPLAEARRELHGGAAVILREGRVGEHAVELPDLAMVKNLRVLQSVRVLNREARDVVENHVHDADRPHGAV